MPTFSESVQIDSGVDQIWQVWTDVVRWPEWTRSVTQVVRLDASSSGQLRVGDRVRIVQPRLGAAIWTVTRAEVPRQFTWELVSQGLTIVADHRLEPDARGARAIATLTIEGPLSGLAAMLAGGLTRRYLAMESQGLKRQSESASGKSRPTD